MGIKGTFFTASRALLSSPGRAWLAVRLLSQDTDTDFQETECQIGALLLCKLPVQLR